MRIERVQVAAFGRLVGYDTGPEPLPGLVVVLGPNEAGKSTLFHCLTTLLYGFRPASRENNPFVPWTGLDLAAEAAVRLDSGGCLAVERRLLSQPTGRMTLDGRAEDLRNRALPWTEHVPPQVFRQVFALTLSELAELHGETWGAVQDRIVGSMGTSDVGSARDVAASLEREAGELWRPNRRGKQRIRDIEEDIRALRVRRREALQRDAELRALVAERDRTRGELQAAREERQRERLALEHVQELLPVRRQLRRIEALRTQAEPAAALEDLPPEPEAYLEELVRRREALMGRRSELEQEAREPERIRAAYGAEEADLVARAGAITAFSARAAGSALERARARGLEEEIQDLERRLEAAGGKVLSTSWRDVPTEAWDALSLEDVRMRVRSFLTSDEELRILREAERRSRAAGTDSHRLVARVWGVGAALAGVAVLVLGLRAGNVLAVVVGAALAVVGLGLLVAAGTRARRGSAAEARERIRATGEVRERAQTALVQLFHDVPVQSGLLETPSLLLVTDLEALQDARRERGERMHALEAIREGLGELDTEARTLASRSSFDELLNSGVLHGEAVAQLLERALSRAQRLRDAAGGAERELLRIGKERERAQRGLEEVEAELAELRRRLAQLGEGDPEAGARRATERLQALRRAIELQDELERSHPSLDELVARIAEAEQAGESWIVDEDDLVRRSARIEESAERIEALATRAESLEGSIARLREMETVDAVDSATITLQEEADRSRLERDRRWLLASVLRHADRRFRDEHQPDLIRRAGRFLGHFTGGRYDRIVADETTRGDLFHVAGPALPGPFPLTPPVSTGTLEQAYLSLRLAIVDHLDQGGERLPLFVDEVFVNWDEERRERGMEVLAGVAETRQIFVFTCHDEVATDLAARGARVLELMRG